MAKLRVVLVVVCLWCAVSLGAATGGLRVTVADEEGRPVEIATVQVWVPTEAGGMRGFDFAAQATAEAGVFRVVGVPAGRYPGVRINKAGYAPAWVDDIEVRSDEETPVALTLLRGGTIAGIVVDENGEPVAGMPVVVNAERCRRDVVTDASGRFVAEHLYDTKYSISAEPKSGSPYALAFSKEWARPGATDVRIALKQKKVTEPSSASVQGPPELSVDNGPSLDDMAKAARGSQKAARVELVGQAAPPLVVERWYNGSFWQLDVKGKVVLLHFWGVWCGPCKRQIPQIRRLAREYGDKGLVTIGVHTQLAKEGLPDFLAENDLPYLIAVDHGGTTAETYRVTGYPTIAVVDRKGVLKEFNPADLEATIKGLLAEIPMATKDPAQR